MKENLKIVFICLILVILIPLNVFSQEKKSFQKIRISKLLKGLELLSPRIILKNEKNLKLEPKQKKLIESEILSYKKFIIKNGAMIKINELELVSLLSKEPVNRQKIAEKIRENGKLKTDSFIKYIKHLFNIKDILSKKQIEFLKRYKPNRQRNS